MESKAGKKRLVVNLRYLNRFLWKQKFKYKDLRTALLLLEKVLLTCLPSKEQRLCRLTGWPSICRPTGG